MIEKERKEGRREGWSGIAFASNRQPVLGKVYCEGMSDTNIPVKTCKYKGPGIGLCPWGKKEIRKR